MTVHPCHNHHEIQTQGYCLSKLSDFEPTISLLGHHRRMMD